MSDQWLPNDFIESAAEIAKFLGPGWNERKVYHIREVGGLPIRRRPGIGLYAFKSELIAVLKDPSTLKPADDKNEKPSQPG